MTVHRAALLSLVACGQSDFNLQCMLFWAQLALLEMEGIKRVILKGGAALWLQLAAVKFMLIPLDMQMTKCVHAEHMREGPVMV